MKNLYIYELSDWQIWAWLEHPWDEVVIITTRRFTKEKIDDILNNWNMSTPIQVISEIKEKWIEWN